MVDQYINAHAGTQNLFDIGKSDSKLKVGLLKSTEEYAFPAHQHDNPVVEIACLILTTQTRGMCIASLIAPLKPTPPPLPNPGPSKICLCTAGWGNDKR